MRIHFINVGYGEAILIQKDDSAVLIDGGTNRAEEYEAPGCIRVTEYLKKIGVGRLDLIVVTHIHDDHIGGIPEVIRNFPVSSVWINLKPTLPDLEKIDQFESVVNGNLSGVLFRNAMRSYAELLEVCESRGISVLQKGSADGRFAIAEDCGFELLAPDPGLQTELLGAFQRLAFMLAVERDALEDPGEDIRGNAGDAEALFYEIDKRGNSSSIALKVKAGKAGALLTGDKVNDWDEIYKKYGTGLESQILKVTHHGQLDGMPRAMLEAANPEFFVICASADRRFHSAHPDLIERAGAFLRERQKSGGIYITGSLQPEGTREKEYCAVCFHCNENTGEIAPRLIGA